MSDIRKYRLTPRPIDIPTKQGFNDTDLFHYQKFGEGLASIFENIETPFVSILDGAWGSGKTTFARQWIGFLKDRDFPVIYFDAFKNDFQEDAFLALAAEITSTTKSLLGEQSSQKAKFLERVESVGKTLTPIATRVALRAATFGFLSSDDFKDASDGVKELIKQSSEDLGAFLGDTIKSRVEQVEDDRASIELFRENLSQLAEEFGKHLASKNTDAEAGSTNNKPLVFIVDELDRCRPTFAVNLLERIKHLFATSGVAFLLVTNMDQLQAAIRGTYGQDSDARTYLEKFYDVRFELPSPTNLRRGNKSQYVAHLYSELNIREHEFSDDFKKIFLNALTSMDVSLRTIEKIFSSIILILSANNSYSKSFEEVFIIAILSKHFDKDLYQNLKYQNANFEKISKFLHLEKWSAHRSTEEMKLWMKHVSSDTPSKIELEKMEKISLYTDTPGREIFSAIADEIDNFIVNQEKFI